MNSRVPTERQIQLFNKACADVDYIMVEYFLYYYEMPFIDGYRLGNRAIKKLIKMDYRRKITIDVSNGNNFFIFNEEGERIPTEIDLNNLYENKNNICHCTLFGRKRKLDRYLITKSLIIFLNESGNRESKSAIRRLPKDLIRYAATFF